MYPSFQSKTGLNLCLSTLAQLWKLDGNLLRNKANFWKSNDTWRLKPEGLVYIEDISNDQVLTITKNGSVKGTTLKQNDARQVWKKANTSQKIGKPKLYIGDD